MVPYMTWILIVYAAAVLFVHIWHSRSQNNSKTKGKPVHYTLIVHNHENQMEWYLRALLWYSGLRARPLKITVLDGGSVDDTLAIVDLMKRAGKLDVTVITIKEEQGSSVFQQYAGKEDSRLVDLRIPQEATKIPFVQVTK